VHRAGAGDESPVDLASFIADLLAEVEAVRRGEKPVPIAPAPAPRSLDEAAEKLRAEGRVGLSDAEWEAAAGGGRFTDPASRSLFALCVKDLQRGGPEVRAQAAERLGNLGGPDAAAVLAAALNREKDGAARKAMLRAAFKCAKDARALCEAYLRDPDAGVRLEALEGARTDEAVVLRMLDDAEVAVRRRAAAIAAGFGTETSRAALAARGFDPLTGSAPASRRLHAVTPAPAHADAVLVSVRAALRGRAPDELANDLGWSEAEAASALARLETEGRLVRRGRRYYAA
jgi:hypothetical protein